METILRKNTRAFLNDGIKTIAHSDQNYFMSNVNDSIEKGFKMMIEGLEIYCASHKKANDSLVGNDGYTGRYIEEILHGLRGLESAQGRFDGGTLDKTLCEIAELNKLDIE